MDKENKAVKNDTPLMFKDLAIRECEKIPSNNKILYKTTQVSHVIERKIGKLHLEKHIITIEWVQFQDKAESEGVCDH